jgi:hypothetical protein
MGVVRARRTCQPSKWSRTHVLRIATAIAFSVGWIAAAPSVSAGQPSLDTWGLRLIGSHRDDHHLAYSYLPECRTSGLNCPRFLGYVEPDLAGECLRFDLDKRVAGVWTDVAGWDPSRCHRMVSADGDTFPRSKALTRFRYDGRQATLGEYRVKMRYPGGQSHQAAHTGWVRFRVIR